MTRHLFFLPGVGADPDFWRPLGDRLPPDWRKTYFGWPGLGDQPADPAINSYDDLIGLVEARLPEYPVDVLAQSMSGAIALTVALRHPERIRRLALAVTSGGMDMSPFGAEDWRPDYRREYSKAAEWVMAEKPDISNRLSEISQPALLIWGDADPISPVATGRYLAERLTNAELHIVEGGRHDLIHSRASEVAGLIERHLS
jgi:pimeloyl-ACP methyl ester carboxylesterase